MGTSTPSLSSIKYQTAEFNHGLTSIFDEDPLGCSNEITTSEMGEIISSK